MDVYRKKPLPAIYTQLGFVRESGPFLIADCPEDLPRLQQLQKIVAGNACLSEIEWSHAFFVKAAAIPDDVLIRDGTSDAVIKWVVFYWKLYDAESELLVNRCVKKAQAAFSSGTWLTGTPLTYSAPW